MPVITGYKNISVMDYLVACDSESIDPLRFLELLISDINSIRMEEPNWEVLRQLGEKGLSNCIAENISSRIEQVYDGIESFFIDGLQVRTIKNSDTLVRIQQVNTEVEYDGEYHKVSYLEVKTCKHGDGKESCITHRQRRFNPREWREALNLFTKEYLYSGMPKLMDSLWNSPQEDLIDILVDQLTNRHS